MRGLITHFRVFVLGCLDLPAGVDLVVIGHTVHTRIPDRSSVSGTTQLQTVVRLQLLNSTTSFSQTPPITLLLARRLNFSARSGLTQDSPSVVAVFRSGGYRLSPQQTSRQL